MNNPQNPKSNLVVPESYLTGATKKRLMQSTPSTDVDDADYWWNSKPKGDDVEAVFEGVDDELIRRQIKVRIEKNEMSVIEIPENVMRTLKILDNPDFSYHEVSRLIERSPAMAGEFLKIINSAFIGTGAVISDLKSALPRLGKVKVKSLLFIYSSRMNFIGSRQFNDVAVDIVEHSYAVGLIASYLSQRYYPAPDTAFLAGLLHDIGKLAIIKALTETHAIPTKLDFPITEEVFHYVFPTLHEQAGAFIAMHWRLDDDVKNAILHHHDLRMTNIQSQDPELTVNLCHLINVSDAMARMLGKGRSLHEEANVFRLPSAKALGIEKDWSTIDFLKVIPEMIGFKLDR